MKYSLANFWSFGLMSVLMSTLMSTAQAQADDQWVQYSGKSGPGMGHHIVLISGDEEYRSEEALPQLGKILAVRHGFKCTVLFALDPDGTVNPNNQNNIPGTELLQTADLMIIATRYRDLPEEQMKPINDYLKSGRPVIGMRTATHAFNVPKDKPYAHYGNGYRGPSADWIGGFGRLVLGEKWISHHGWHKQQSTRGLIADGASSHPIVRGIKDGDIWGPSDVYGVRLPLPGDSKAIVLGQVLEGMNPDDGPATTNRKGDQNPNDPMMPIAWTKSYKIPGGKVGRVFNTTMGAATDLTSEGTRRMIVNGVYWSLGLDDQIPAAGADVAIVGKFNPTPYGFHREKNYWQDKGMKPSDHAL